MRAALVALALLLAGCLGAPPTPEDEPEAPDVDAADVPVVRFLVVGDTGTGEEPQYRVARAMATVCADLGCDFVVGTGDNIYEVGPTSAYDPQFDLKFEEPYADLDVPFLMTLGNHDTGGTGQAWHQGDIEVEYAARDDRASEKWVMPDRWYVHEAAHATFVALDTNIIFGPHADLTGDPRGEVQGPFVDEALGAAGNATWRFTFGHHPYISNGQHGDASTALTAWYESHVCGRVDLLIAGHDHDLQWLRPVDACGDTQFLVSGAGAKPRPLGDPDRHEAVYQRGDGLGFAWLEARGTTLTLRFYDDSATLLHEGSITKSGAE